ncbi:MAG: hypothetical protein C5B49_06120 [Bdellovibrio sp.]|nr:MAG: hypothetical protein C5B49_06120 [Bdellovibrio sp.]
MPENSISEKIKNQILQNLKLAGCCYSGEWAVNHAKKGAWALMSPRVVNHQNMGFYLAIVLFIVALAYTRAGVEANPGSGLREYIAPPTQIQYFTFGYRHCIADMLWIRSLQDFNFCEKKDAQKLCKGKGWLYKMLDLMTDLSPHFRMAYLAGAMALTIVISDIEGASKFIDKGVAEFPTDWKLLYQAGYHAAYEEKNIKKAAGLIESAARNGAPSWVYGLAAKLYDQAGKKDLGVGLLRQLEEAREKDPDNEFLNEAIERLKGDLELSP